jgi:xanthine dehydrogenase accessory factor
LRYLGLLGSRRKIERVRAELRSRGVDLGSLPVELHAPIGLPIGGDSPGEIALAILAEIVAVRRGARIPVGVDA